MKRIAFAGILICLIAVCACSNNTSTNPVTPQLPETTNSISGSSASSPPGHSLLGYYSIMIDPDAGEAVATPMRSTSWHLNAIKFIEPPSGGSLLSFSNMIVTGTIVNVDISIQHPFPAVPQYSGFDVKGIVIGPADIVDQMNPTRQWAGGPDGLRLLNSDGLTRWWNPMEFPYNGTVFSHRDGLYGTPASVGDFNSTLSGYKVFASVLEPDNPLTYLLLYPVDHHLGRSVFRSSDIVTRHYELMFPADDNGDPSWVFNYAIDASHGLPVDYEPGEYIEVPDGFPPDANQLEPFVLDVQIPVNTTYLSSEGCVGGLLELHIRVCDWQALLTGTPIDDQLESIEVTSPNLFLGTRTPELLYDWVPEMPWATYRIMLDGLLPDSIYNQQVLVTVVSADGDYQPDVSSYTGSEPLTSHYLMSIPISQITPPGGTGFMLNPLAPWPKPGGSIHNTNMTDSIGPDNPSIAWQVSDLSSHAMAIVDPEGRVFLSRAYEDDGIELLVYDLYGSPVAELQFPDFNPAGDPMMVGCSLLWNDVDGNVIRLYQDGTYELLFAPLPGPGPHAFGMLNIDKAGNAYVHGPSSIQAFNQYGELNWVRNGIDGAPSMFIGPPTITVSGQVIVGKVDLDSSPPGGFEIWCLNPGNGEIIWSHSPMIDETIAYSTAADPLTGQIYYTITNHIVALSSEGEQRWIYTTDNYLIPDIAVAPDGTVYTAESVIGQSGGIASLIALGHDGQFKWDFKCPGETIVAGPITDISGNVYFATDDGIIRAFRPNGDLLWSYDLDSRPSYIVFGPPHSILVGIRESLFETSVVCLMD